MRFCLLLCLRLSGALCLLAMGACTANIRMVINPDNSGKMIISARTMTWGKDAKSVSEIINEFKPGQASAASVEQSIIDMFPSMLAQFQGITVWSDAEYREEDHTSYFTITGYFPDATKVSAGYASATPGSGLVKSSAVDKDGKWIIVLSTPRLTQTPAQPDGSPKPAVDKDVAAEQAEESLETARMIQDTIKQELPKIDAMISVLPDEAGYGTDIEVGGKLLKAEGDYKIKGGSVAGEFTSVKDKWQVFKKIADDEKTLTALIRLALEKHGKPSTDPGQIDPQTVSLLYEFLRKNSPTDLLPDRLIVEPGRAVFNYKAEAAEAAKRPGHLLKPTKKEEPQPTAKPD